MSRTLAVLLLAATLFAGEALASPEIRVTASRGSVQKGGILDLRLEITARETLTDIGIAPLVPFGFRLDPVATAGVTVSPEDGTVRIAGLREGSGIALLFRVRPPGLRGKPHGSAEPVPVSTAEPKVFTFNVFYTMQRDGGAVAASQTVATSVQYTTAMGLYLAAGMLGMILGHLIKTGTKHRDELHQALQARTGVMAKFAAGSSVMGMNMSGLFTVLVVGFGGLLVLAREGIPVASWHQAVALGIGLAVVADDELLAKLRGGK